MTLFFAFLLLISVQPEADSYPPHTQKIVSTIDQVTVYRDGALVRRSSDIQVPAGTSELVFTGLTRQIRDETITLRTVQGSLTLLSLNVQSNPQGSDHIMEKLDSLRTIKQNLEERMVLLNADQSVLNRELDLLNANQSLTGGEGFDLAELKDVMEFYRDRFRYIETQKIEINKQVNQTGEELEEINQKIHDLENEIRSQSNEVVALIDSPSEQHINVELSYVSYRAGWTPSYDVRYSGMGTPLVLDYKAEVFQNTGEDWNEVQLNISSGQHQRRSTIPDMPAEYIDFQPEEAARDVRARMQLDEAVVAAAPRAPSPGESVRIDEQVRFSYEIQEPHTISSGERVTLPFHREETTAEFHHVTVPKLDSGVFLVTEIQDWEALHLIDGAANLFMHGSFTGKSRISTGVFDESLQLSLGQNDFILAERKRVRDVTSRNYFGNRTRENHGWEIVLRNTGSDPVSVTIKDQIPVSRQSAISVELTERSGAQYHENTGILEWDVDLEPGQAQILPFSYRIEYPRDRQVRRIQN